MQKWGSLAETVLAENVMVWGGAAVSLFALAGENTFAVFHGQWYNICGWAVICVIVSAITIIRILEGRRLRSRLPR